MDKDGTTTHRRHRPGPGAPPMGVGPAYLKAASEMAELQRSRSVGGLLQKGDPPSCIKKLCKELESEDPGKDVRSEAEDASCQASLEDKQDGGQDARGQAPEDAKVEEASTCREQPAGGEGADECAPEDEELEPESIKLDDLLEKEARESRFSGGIRRGGRGARFCCGCRNHLCLWRLTWETVPRSPALFYSALRTLPGAQGAPVSGGHVHHERREAVPEGHGGCVRGRVQDQLGVLHPVLHQKKARPGGARTQTAVLRHQRSLLQRRHGCSTHDAPPLGSDETIL
nr:uncharacterized protein C13H13orf46 isoform X3 [Bubalus bubalis]